MLLVAPTERQLHAVLSGREDKWRISSLPEQHGCDILIPTKYGIVGFQRKTLPDLLASLQDGRLYYELNQLSVSASVSVAFLLVEGGVSTFSTTTDGNYFTEANISVGTFRSILAKFAVHGVGSLTSRNPRDTIDAVLSVSKYISSGRALSVQRTKAVTNEWGQVTNRAYGIFLLQSFPGIGPKVAAAIYDHFGTVPIAWTVNPAELARVPGIGRKRAEALMASLRHSRPAAGSDTP